MTKKVIKKVSPQDLEENLAAIQEAAGKGELCIVANAQLIAQLSKLSEKSLLTLSHLNEKSLLTLSHLNEKSLRVLSQLSPHQVETLCSQASSTLPPTPAQVAQRAEQYVRRSESLATLTWRPKVMSLWHRILTTPAFLVYLTPSCKARKERLCNLYTLLAIVGVMRSHGIYDECLRDVQLANAITLAQGDNSYRAAIGRGMEDRKLKKQLVEWIEEMQT